MKTFKTICMSKFKKTLGTVGIYGHELSVDFNNGTVILTEEEDFGIKSIHLEPEHVIALMDYLSELPKLMKS